MNSVPSYVLAALDSGWHWYRDVITYSVPVAGSGWDYSGEPTDSQYAVLSSQQAIQVRKAVAAWDDLIPISLLEVSEPVEAGRIRVAFSGHDTADNGGDVAGWSYFPGLLGASGDVWLNSGWAGETFQPGSYAYTILLHELGHALGLEHPFAEETGDVALPVAEDNHLYTLMSYHEAARDQAIDFSASQRNGLVWKTVVPDTPMLYDVAAIQAIYGADYTSHADDTTYTFADDYIRNPFYRTLWDGGGVDTIDASGQTNPSLVNLEAGSFSSIGYTTLAGLKSLLMASFPQYARVLGNSLNTNAGSLYTGENNLSIAYGAVIENAIGGQGSDKLYGNAADNQLAGGRGNDLLDGKEGYDTALYTDTHELDIVLTDKNGQITVSYIQRQETDTLLNMEELRFADASYYSSESANQLFRVYQAAFARQPDAGGLEYWLGRNQDGMTLYDIAASFTQSAESQSIYGSILNKDVFINNLYQNVLGRAADGAGFTYWRNQLDEGFSQPQDMLLSFSESAENIHNFSVSMGDGFWLA